MQTADDLIITLQPPVNTARPQRLIEVDLTSRVNPYTQTISSRFDFNDEIFSDLKSDPFKPNQILVSINNSIVLRGIEGQLAITYYASSINGDTLKGRVVFRGLNFDIGAAPITYNLDSCTLPNKIVIDVQSKNNDLSVSLVSVGDNNASAAAITTIDSTGSDYNNDFGDDFGGTPRQQIIYSLDADFWKAYAAQDQFTYTISYMGKTATNTITIQKNINNL